MKKYVHITRKVYGSIDYSGVLEVTQGGKLQFVCGDSWYADGKPLGYYTNLNQQLYITKFSACLEDLVGEILLNDL